MKLCCAETTKPRASSDAYILLARVVETEYGCALPRIDRTANGKPFFPDRPDIHFSLSHTGTHVLCAVSDCPVGVDVELVRTVRDGVPERVCTGDELKLFDFHDLWVLKESYIKLHGGTLSWMSRIAFSRVGDRILTPDRCSFARLYSGIAGCRAAVCSAADSFPDAVEFISIGEI